MHRYVFGWRRYAIGGDIGIDIATRIGIVDPE